MTAGPVSRILSDVGHHSAIDTLQYSISTELRGHFCRPEIAAWITNMGRDIVVEYADETLRYDNYSTDIEIKTWDGTWEPYDPDEHYKVDFRQDPETGKLLIYNNDLDTYDPYMEAYRPAGANYTVLNEGASIHIVYDDGAELWLENYGEGAWLKAPETGERWVTLPGSLVYRDDSTGIWWYNGYGIWHYSIDTRQTWVDVPMLDIRVVEGAGIVDWFDGKQWTHLDPVLEFFDSRYAQSGWHNMTYFVVEYYDGVGYDGEPLKVVEMAIYPEQSNSSVWLNNLTPSGANPEGPLPDKPMTEWNTYVYGQWSNKILVSWSVPNPAQDFRGTFSCPVTVLINSDDSESPEGMVGVRQDIQDFVETSLEKNTILLRFGHDSYSLKEMVRDLEIVHYVVNHGEYHVTQIPIQNLAINQHGSPGSFTVGTTSINWSAWDLVPTWLVGNKQTGSEAEFKRLNAILADDGQIQHYGCDVARINPFYNSQDVPWIWDLGRYLPYKARCMLATIANWTHTVVFASSDAQIVNLETVGGRCEVANTEMCLEFGVDFDGRQVSFEDCAQEVWDLALWTPAILSADQKAGSLQTLWDMDRSVSGGVPTKGEPGGPQYEFLTKGL
jgi:hypothetical protein